MGSREAKKRFNEAKGGEAMKRFLAIFFIALILWGGICFANEVRNPYIPQKVNIWIDKEFLKYCEDLAYKDYKSYSTDETEKELIRQLIDLLRLQLKTNLILIKQNKELIELIKKNSDGK